MVGCIARQVPWFTQFINSIALPTHQPQRASSNDSGNSSAKEGEFEDMDKDDKEKK